MALSQQEEAELATLEKKSLNSSEEAELAALEARDKPSGMMDYIGRGLDYENMLTRAPLAQLSGLAKPGEITQAAKLQGRIPDSSELMRRAGVPAGKSLSDVLPSWLNPYEEPEKTRKDTWWPDKGGWFDPTARGLGGTIADITMSPSTYVPFLNMASIPGRLGKALVGAQKAISPSKWLGKGGEALYDSALRPVINEGERRGKTAVSDVFYKSGVWGSPRRWLEKTQEAGTKLKGARDAIMKEADDAGATLNRSEAFKPALDTLKDFRKRKLLDREQASEFIDSIRKKEWLDGTPPNLTDATAWKTQVNKGLPDHVWNQVKHLDEGEKLQQVLSTGLKEGVEKGVERTLSPQKAAEFAQHNSDLGQILSTQKSTLAAAQKSGKNAMDFADWLILSGEAPVVSAPAMWGVKKATDVARTPWAKSTLGYGLRKWGDSKLVGPIADAILRDQFRKQPKNLTNITPDEEKKK